MPGRTLFHRRLADVRVVLRNAGAPRCCVMGWSRSPHGTQRLRVLVQQTRASMTDRRSVLLSRAGRPLFPRHFSAVTISRFSWSCSRHGWQSLLVVVQQLARRILGKFHTSSAIKIAIPEPFFWCSPRHECCWRVNFAGATEQLKRTWPG